MNDRHTLASVDLNLLVALDALLQERSVTRAAARLSLTQPAVSAALARLRHLLGDDILVRSGRTMHATALAESLQAPVREILARIEDTVLSKREFDPMRDGRTFRVLATDYTALVLLRPLIETLAGVAPNVRLRIEAIGIERHADALQRGEIDLAITPERFGMGTSLPRTDLFADEFVAVVWRGNRVVGDSLTIEQLADLPYLTYRLGPTPHIVDSALSELGLQRDPEVVVESFVFGAMMLRGSPHFTFLQRRLASALAAAAELRLVAPPIAFPAFLETMAWHPRSADDPAHRWLRARILEQAGQLPGANR